MYKSGSWSYGYRDRIWSPINWRESATSNWHGLLILKFDWLNFGCCCKGTSMLDPETTCLSEMKLRTFTSPQNYELQRCCMVPAGKENPHSPSSSSFPFSPPSRRALRRRCGTRRTGGPLPSPRRGSCNWGRGAMSYPQGCNEDLRRFWGRALWRIYYTETHINCPLQIWRCS